MKIKYTLSLLKSLLALSLTANFVFAEGNKTGGWMQQLENGWYSLGWHGGQKENNVIRTWSGDNDTFSGAGGWFSSTWGAEGGNWLPDISRSGPGFGDLTKMVPNYNVQWTGSGSVTSYGSNYTFGLKFNSFNTVGWVDYDKTISFECYIITHSNKATSVKGRFIGTVYPEGDPVGYDCYVYDADWQPHGEFIQLWAFRRENTWSGPVNVQAILKFWSENSGTNFNKLTWKVGDMSIMIETFDTAGTFRIENIQIPDFDTALLLNP